MFVQITAPCSLTNYTRYPEEYTLSLFGLELMYYFQTKYQKSHCYYPAEDNTNYYCSGK